MSPEIQTFKGHYFNLLTPENSVIDIEDIAHSLARQCRFTGHTREFYSVASHSLWCSFLVDSRLALEALMHDAAEAYLGDVATPLKQLLPAYKVIEDQVERVVRMHFGLPHPMSPAVKEIDALMLMTEKRDLLKVTTRDAELWHGPEPFGSQIHSEPPEQAEKAFLKRYYDLIAARHYNEKGELV